MKTQRDEIGYVTQGIPRKRVTVKACRDKDSLWVEVRRGDRKPWMMTPEIARGFAGLLTEGADQAERMIEK